MKNGGVDEERIRPGIATFIDCILDVINSRHDVRPSFDDYIVWQDDENRQHLPFPVYAHLLPMSNDEIFGCMDSPQLLGRAGCIYLDKAPIQVRAQWRREERRQGGIYFAWRDCFRRCRLSNRLRLRFEGTASGRGGGGDSGGGGGLSAIRHKVG